MRTIIAGGRNYNESDLITSLLDEADETLGGISEVVSGGCPSGVDSIGEKWATSKLIPIKRFDALWHIHGKGAGPIRNQQMARYAEALILFPGGKGTKNMLRNARKQNLIIIDIVAELTLRELQRHIPLEGLKNVR